MKLVDYVFVRVFNFYKRKDHIPISMGVMFLFVLFLSLYLLFGICFNLIFDNAYTEENLGGTTYYLISGLILISVIMALTFRYSPRQKRQSILFTFENRHFKVDPPLWFIFCLPLIFIGLTMFIILLFGNS